MNRVGITGMGAISAAGVGTDALWQAARDGVSQISPLALPHGESLRIKVAGKVRDFEPTKYLSEQLLRRCDRFTQFAHIAAEEALQQAAIDPELIKGQRTAIVLGTGIGGGTTIEEACYAYYTGNARTDLLTIPRLMPSSAASHVSIIHGITGPCFTVSSACSSASQAIGIASQLIRAGIVDRAITGGSEACITPASVRAWELLRVLSPDSCRPFSKDRNGMILGEGAGLFVLESEAAMAARGAEPIAWLTGYGTSSDARDIIQPDVDGASSAMKAALTDAGIKPEAIRYVNAHGTGTVLNDVNEAQALDRVFGEAMASIPVSSTKPVIGHALGASGALELVVTISALRAAIVPPHINLRVPDPRCPLYLPSEALAQPIGAAMSNSFAFGGINACLVVTTV